MLLYQARSLQVLAHQIAEPCRLANGVMVGAGDYVILEETGYRVVERQNFERTFERVTPARSTGDVAKARKPGEGRGKAKKAGKVTRPAKVPKKLERRPITDQEIAKAEHLYVVEGHGPSYLAQFFVRVPSIIYGWINAGHWREKREAYQKQQAKPAPNTASPTAGKKRCGYCHEYARKPTDPTCWNCRRPYEGS